jgi:hypothetical protein
LERAEAVAAYLRHDVEAWLEWYEDGKPEEKRWRAHEDRLMITALPGLEEREPGESAVRCYQRSRGLPVDGRLDSAGRRRLVAEYMALGGARLGARPSVAIRGAGESFPPDEDDLTNAAEQHRRQRRVEIYFHDGRLAIAPPAPAPILVRGSQALPEWIRRLTSRYELDRERNMPLMVGIYLGRERLERGWLVVEGCSGGECTMRRVEADWDEGEACHFVFDPHEWPDAVRAYWDDGVEQHLLLDAAHVAEVTRSLQEADTGLSPLDAAYGRTNANTGERER